MQLAQCTLEIDLAKIKANYRILRNICTNSAVGAAVKANSYGLGANEVSKALEEENCRFFFVASSIEGINLRKILSSHSNILVLNGVAQSDAAEFIEYNLIPVLNNLEQIKIWQQFAKTRNQLLPCFLHFNTGINRLGLTHAEIEHIINDRDLLEGLQLQYIISHLAASEEAENPYNLEQLTKFKSYLQHFPGVKTSLASSAAIFLGKNYHFDLVRPGMALYGLNPLGKGKPNPMQNPVTLTAPIIHLQKLTAGSSIGYNRSFTTERDSVIATLPLGYADGYSRNFSNCGEVFINGYVAPVIGRVSMDLVNIDVTDLPHSQIFLGQQVEIIGNYCTPDKIANIIGTIGYEILTSLGNRYKRVYKNDT
ncbi:alanine racemase [Rickettsia endosymbiont of Polydrusus tereticollis]|uniref:alanine racemase n=1 Tax=Rickettsia endosymbiont of Polydrusus tereticollis TaxID=3066251 RepID=UPI003132DB0C